MDTTEIDRFAKDHLFDVTRDELYRGYDFDDHSEAEAYAEKVNASEFFVAHVSDESFESNEDEAEGENGWTVVTVTLDTVQARKNTLENIVNDFEQIEDN